MARTRWIVLLALGCGPVISPDDTGDGSVGDTGTDSNADSTSGTTAGTTASTTASTTADTTASTTATPTGCASDYISGCQSYCAATITCDPDLGSYEECVNDLCDETIAAASAECQQIYCEALTCYGVLDCATLDNGAPECEAMAAAAEAACGGLGSECAIGVSDGTSCEYICDDELQRRMVCEVGSCSCFEDDEIYAECPSDGVCETSESILETTKTCCGF